VDAHDVPTGHFSPLVDASTIQSHLSKISQIVVTCIVVILCVTGKRVFGGLLS
jgi:hypothetical protein